MKKVIKSPVEKTNVNSDIKNNPNYILMHSQHTMASGNHGVSIEHTSLGFINTLKSRYNKIVGFKTKTKPKQKTIPLSSRDHSR